MRAETEDVIEQVRGICLGLPKVVEHGGTASGVGALSGTSVVGFKVSGRVVARLFILDPDGREDALLWLRADPEERAALLRAGSPYFRGGPREVGIKLGADTDWMEIEELVLDSYLIMAPKKLAAEVEVRLGRPAGRTDEP
jgi:hypothetical protein